MRFILRKNFQNHLIVVDPDLSAKLACQTFFTGYLQRNCNTNFLKDALAHSAIFWHTSKNGDYSNEVRNDLIECASLASFIFVNFNNLSFLFLLSDLLSFRKKVCFWIPTTFKKQTVTSLVNILERKRFAWLSSEFSSKNAPSNLSDLIVYRQKKLIYL
ncbi:MAG: hypothetical protein NZT61_00325 [Deltaproteobacteria bacterium]|nr:hypothetical protein [Deltaproteobacteria bacterium]MCX7952822.1 hypothetical protein [Deltaproteobacteria bacterium]